MTTSRVEITINFYLHCRSDHSQGSHSQVELVTVDLKSDHPRFHSHRNLIASFASFLLAATHAATKAAAHSLAKYSVSTSKIAYSKSHRLVQTHPYCRVAFDFSGCNRGCHSRFYGFHTVRRIQGLSRHQGRGSWSRGTICKRKKVASARREIKELLGYGHSGNLQRSRLVRFRSSDDTSSTSYGDERNCASVYGTWVYAVPLLGGVDKCFPIASMHESVCQKHILCPSSSAQEFSQSFLRQF